MKNSQIFLNSFSAIEDYLHKYTNTIEHHDSFANLVNKASHSSSIIREYKTDLFELKDLRNAIVHERSDGHVIAEPHDGTVKLIQKIESLLMDPPLVIPTFAGEVGTLCLSDSLEDAALLMNEKSYTQIPILDRNSNYYDLLTTNTIVKWLGSHTPSTPELVEVSLKEVLEYKEDNNHCRFISPEADFVEVLELFDEYHNSSKKLEAVIITPHGEPDEEFLGIITNRDLPVIYDKLEV